MLAAARLLEIAGDDAKAITEQRDAEEREHALRSLGIAPGQAVPPALRAQLKALEDDQKRRATRSLRDGIDRILVDLASLYRDILLIQLGADVELVNRELLDDLRRAAACRHARAHPRDARRDPDGARRASRATCSPRSRSRRCSSPRSAPPHRTRGRMSAPHTTTRSADAASPRAAGIARVAVAASWLALAGCVPVVPARRRRASATSTPTGEEVARRARAVLLAGARVGAAAATGMQCATAKAPLDWSDPGAGEIELALVRQLGHRRHASARCSSTPAARAAPATTSSRDSLDFAVGEPLQAALRRRRVRPARRRPVDRRRLLRRRRRWTSSSTASCPAERGSDEWIDERRVRRTADFGEACVENTGDLLGHVDTESAARDLDLLRAVLGDEQLNYLGYSYGTFLGATYAELYPEQGRPARARRRDRPVGERLRGHARRRPSGFESALRAYLEDCLAGQRLPVRRHRRRRRWTRSAACSPRSTRARCAAPTAAMVGADTLFTAIIYPLYSADSWPYLSEMFDAVMFGDGRRRARVRRRLQRPQRRRHLPRQLDRGVHRRSTASTTPYQSDVDDDARGGGGDRRGGADRSARTSATATSAASNWPYQPTASAREIHAEGAAPILVVGTTNDPATPYEWAVALADQLDSGVLVTYEGEGHTAYNKSNACVNDAVESYLIDGTVPASRPEVLTWSSRARNPR